MGLIRRRAQDEIRLLQIERTHPRADGVGQPLFAFRAVYRADVLRRRTIQHRTVAGYHGQRTVRALLCRGGQRIQPMPVKRFAA